MTGEALRVDFPTVSLPTNNINQQTSLLMFVRHTLHRKLVLTKILFDVYFRLDATLPIVERLIFLYHCNFDEYWFTSTYKLQI